MDFKAGNGSGNKNNLDTEKSFLESIESRYKDTYFWALFVLLKEEDSSIIFSILGALITFLQLLIYPFHPNVRPADPDQQHMEVRRDPEGHQLHHANRRDRLLPQAGQVGSLPDHLLHPAVHPAVRQGEHHLRVVLLQQEEVLLHVARLHALVRAAHAGRSSVCSPPCSSTRSSTSSSV